MIYLLGWSTLYFTWLLQGFSGYRGRFFLLLSLFILGSIAFFRGDVGTDTRNYELMFIQFSEGYQWDGRELGFVVLARLLSAITPSIEIAVRAVSLVLFVWLAWFVHRSDRNERTMLLLYFLPVFVYQYGMNALRAGLAFALILLMTQALRRASGKKAMILGATSVFFHYSALVPLAYLYLTHRAWMKLSTLAWASMFMVAAGAVFVLAQGYFLDKMSAYTNMYSPSLLSGVSIVVPLCLILIGMLFGRLPVSEKSKLFVLGVSSLSASWLLARLSYAGLRILDLLAYAVPLSILMAYSRHRLPIERVLSGALLLAGLLSAIAAYYRFTSEYTIGSSPWLPYQTWLNGF